ncbi:MAG: hypothetical protein V8R51_08435 [Clostridia bacterium]
MQVDTGLESYINAETGEMMRDLRYYDLFEYFNRCKRYFLLIGGAASVISITFVPKYKDKKIDVVEIDDKMTRIAVEQFWVEY